MELLKISINEPKVEVVELREKLPFEIRNIGDYNLFLYYARQTNELVSVLRLNTDESHAEVRIHTMLFPPVGVSIPDQSPSDTPWLGYLAGGLGALLLWLLIWKYRNGAQSTQPLPVVDTAVSGIESQVKILGGFKLTDQEGLDITARLSPKLKEIFLLILLHSVGKKTGISTKRLTDILWPDSTAASAKNNRGVNLQKLRQVLKSMPAVEIRFAENKWEAQLAATTTCDLEYALNLLESNNLDTAVGTITGPLLPGTSYEWLDAIKVDVHHQLIQLLITQIEAHEHHADWSRVVMLSRSILLIDPVHDDALRHQLRALVQLKKAGQAQATYEQFTDRYKQLYDEPYPIGFEEILS